MAPQPAPIQILTTRRSLSSTGFVKTVKQAAADPANEWGVDRIIVLFDLTPSDPILPEEIAAIIRASEFKGVYYSTVQGGVLELPPK